MTSHQSLAETSTKVIDPVCSMKIVPEKAEGTQEFDGRTFHFCSRSCVAIGKAVN